MQCEIVNLWFTLALVYHKYYNRADLLLEEPLKSMALSLIFPFLGLEKLNAANNADVFF